ncbi:phospholipase A [uncultured Psychrobacter sp.]|uniref:phospholipase A n=1 Tax=uncultured Psychrobacter sp. TaxID=259303 RepID=UPI00345766ED
MFAHNIFQHQVQRNQPKSLGFQKFQTHLSFAIGIVLSGVAIQGHAANNGQVYNELPVEDVLVETDNNSSAAMAYSSTNLTANAASIPSNNAAINASIENQTYSNDYAARPEELFLECTEVQTSAARLACYDKVAQQGRTPTYTMTKQPVDLAKTLKKTITGDPQLVLAQEDDATTVDSEPAAKSSKSNQRLDTIGLTKREAEVLEQAGVTQSDVEKYSVLSLAYDLDQNSERGTWTARPHNPNYILPLFYSFDPNLSPTSSDPDIPREEYSSNDIRNTELKFQLSLKTKVAEDLFDTSADLWFGYTQQAHWQVYNEDNSRPFRGTDYQPEIFLTQPVTANLPFGGRLRMLGVGAVHHSNGRSDPISRSWNRAYLMGGAEWGKLTVIPRVWARIKNENDDADDNPDITDYMGYGDLTLLYGLPNQQSISSTLRYNPNTNKGAAQIDYTYPLTKNVNGFVQLFQGYGESLIDYNYENTAIGFGIVLNDWKGF